MKSLFEQFWWLQNDLHLFTISFAYKFNALWRVLWSMFILKISIKTDKLSNIFFTEKCSGRQYSLWDAGERGWLKIHERFKWQKLVLKVGKFGTAICFHVQKCNFDISLFPKPLMLAKHFLNKKYSLSLVLQLYITIDQGKWLFYLEMIAQNLPCSKLRTGIAA